MYTKFSLYEGNCYFPCSDSAYGFTLSERTGELSALPHRRHAGISRHQQVWDLMTDEKAFGDQAAFAMVQEACRCAIPQQGWQGMFAAAGTPTPARQAARQDQSDPAVPDVAAKIDGFGTTVGGITPEEFAQTLRADAGVYARIIKAANIRLTSDRSAGMDPFCADRCRRSRGFPKRRRAASSPSM